MEIIITYGSRFAFLIPDPESRITNPFGYSDMQPQSPIAGLKLSKSAAHGES